MKSSKNGSSKVSFERLQAKYYIKQDSKRTPVVSFLDDFFHRSIILIELVAMALHHVEEVPEHFSEHFSEQCNSCLRQRMLLVDCPEVDVGAGADELVYLNFKSAAESEDEQNVKEFGDIL